MAEKADGHIIINTKINSDGVKNLKNDLEGVTGIAGKLSFALKALASTAAFRYIARGAISAAEAAASLNAKESALRQTFRDMEADARLAFTRISQSTKILDTRLQSAGTSIYAFAKASGMDSASALRMMEDALTAAADSAAYYDKSIEDMTETLKSYLKGNYANDAALGISSTETTRNAAAMKLYAKSFADLTEAQKQLTLLQMVKDANRLSGAEGQAAREADGWENVLGNLRETWNLLTAQAGQGVLGILIPAMQKLTGVLQKVLSYVKDINAYFGWGASDAAENVNREADAVENLKDAAEDAKKSMAGFDELNQLSGGGNSSSVTTAGAEAASGIAIDVQVPQSVDTSWIDDIAEKVQNALEKTKAYISETYGPTISAFHDAFAEMEAAAVPAIQKVGGAVVGLWNDTEPTRDYIVNTFVPDVVNAWSDNLLPVIADLTAVSMANTASTIETSCAIISDAINTIYAPAMETAHDIGVDTANAIGDMWEQRGEDIVTATEESNKKQNRLLTSLYNNIVKPVLTNIGNVVDWLWDKHLKKLWERLVDFGGAVWELILALYNRVLLPVFDWIAATAGPVISWIAGLVMDVVGTAVAFVSDVIADVLLILTGVIDFLTGIFTNDWEKAWEGIVEIFSGVWELITDVTKGAINLVIDLLNGLWTGLYSALAAIVNGGGSIIAAIGDVLGRDWNFSIPLDPPKIPKLAQGAVIPANNEFLAVLGDQKSGTNIETPLSTMVEAFKMALKEGDGGRRTVVFEVDKRQFAKVVFDLYGLEDSRIGIKV